MKTTKFSRIISLVLVFVMLSGMLVFDTGAKAVYDEKNESLFTYVIEGEGDGATVTILKCSDKATGKVVIPAEIDGVPVTKIDKGAFEGCSSITSLVIPEEVEVIGGETPEVTITKEDYLDLFVKRGLIYHLNFVGVEADTKIQGASEKYNDETALATERFASVSNDYWNQYIYDNVKGENDGDLAYVSAGIPTVDGGWKFKTPYTRAFWFNEDGSQNHTAGNNNDFADFVTVEGLEGIEYAGTSSQVTIGEETRTVYDVIHTAPQTATGFYITEGVDGKTVYSSYMGDGYMRLNHAGSVGYMQANVDQLSGDYTVELALKQPASVRQDAYYMQCGTLVETLVNTESNYLYLKSGADYYYMTGLVTQGIIKYTVTADRDAEGSGATAGFFVNGRNDFVASDKATPVSSTKQLSSLSKNFWVQMQAPGVETYAIRVYDTVLTEAEILQNNFADIATVAQLDISEFLKLTETEKQDVYTAFKGVDASEAPSILQIKLNAAVDGTRAKQEYYDLFVQDGLVYHMNFAEAKDDATVASDATYSNFLVYAKDGITNPWSGAKGNSFGNGYFILAGGTSFYFYKGGVDGLIKGAKAVSVELTMGTDANGRSNFYPSFSSEFNIDNSNLVVYRSNTAMFPANSTAYPMYLSGGKGVTNTYSFTYGFNYQDESEYKFDFNAYSTGKVRYTYAITSTASYSGYVTNSGQFSKIAGSDYNIYAMRVYEKELDAAEIRQNHFADIALINELDISKFVKATEEEKQAVYTAFENVNASVDKATLQATLDAALPEEVVEDPNRQYYDLFVKDGLIYHINFLTATAGSTVASDDSYLPFVVDKRDGITNPWTGASGNSFGEGYFILAGGTNIYSYKGGVEALLTGADAASIELTMGATAGGRSTFYPGFHSEFNADGSNIVVYRFNTAMFPDGSTDYPMRLPGGVGATNTYSFTYGFNYPDADHNYDFKAYSTGALRYSYTITSGATDAGFVPNSGQFAKIAGSDYNIYAMRIYDKELTADEIRQNHFADIATVNKLDVSAFIGLSDAVKSYVYKAFEGVNVNGDQATLQTKLDEILEFAPYYALFVDDGLVYHINFASATSGSTVTANSTYDAFVVDKKQGITTPWNGATGNSFGDGYFILAGGTNFYFYKGGVNELINGAKAVSVELTMGTDANGRSNFYPSFSSEFNIDNSNLVVYRSNTAMFPANSTAYPMYLSGGKGVTNTYSFTYGFNYQDESEYKFDFNAYSTGKVRYTYAITSTASYSGYVTNSGQFSKIAGSDYNIYAMRVYEKELDAAEIRQNHFADIALINELDISKFVKATEEEKQAVYTAFENVSASAGKDTLQATLDAALPEEEVITYDYYDLFVTDQMLYHLNFAELEETGTKLGSQSATNAYLVYMSDKMTGNPLWGSFISLKHDGYIELNESLTIYGGGVKAMLAEAGAFSVEYVTAMIAGASAGHFTIGPGYNMGTKADHSVEFNTATTYMNPPVIKIASQEGVPFDGENVNTYSFAFDISNLAAYDFEVYANGKHYITKTDIDSGVASFAPAGAISSPAAAPRDVYALRVYAKQLSANETLQNHFADIVTIKALDLDVEKFITQLTADEKLSVYKAFEGLSASEDAKTLQETLEEALVGTALEVPKGMFADCESLTSITVLAESAPQIPADAFSGSSVEEIVVPASAVPAYEEADGWSALAGGVRPVTADDILTFKGYQVRLNKSPGIRSMYSIDRTAIELLEAENKTVIVGSIMAAATNERTTRAALTLPMNNGKYDPTGKIANAAYKEIYHTGEGTDGEGVIGLLTNVTDAAYEFAYTTTYTEAQTNSYVNRGALYVGFVVVIDNATGDETIFYTNEVSPTFDGDDNGEAISLYDLYNHFNADPQYADNEIFTMVFDAKDAAEALVEE